MSDPSANIGALFAASAEGTLKLTKSASETCAEACSAFAAGLDDLRRQVSVAQETGGFGTLNSGTALQNKFAQLLVGGGDFASLKGTLDQHIEVAQRLREVFEKAGVGYARTEEDTTRTITQAGPG